MQRYFVNEKYNNLFKLGIDESNHIKNVMRNKIGDVIEIVYCEEIYLAKIICLNPVTCEIVDKLSINNELGIKITICQTLVKEAKMDFILQKCTELGAYEFVPLKTTNSIIKLNSNDGLKKIERWQKIVRDASRQSKRNIVPQVKNIIDINSLSKCDYDLKILCSVNEVSRSLKNVLQNNSKCATMIIVIGPEGGFTAKEEKLLLENGFISTSLGNLVLRTETAGMCVLSMINYEYER